MKRTAKESDFSSDRTAAGQTADRLIDDRLKDGSSHIFTPGTGIQKRHDVCFCENAAA